ncbi:hypothetical protein DFQ29_000558 [Apophysomyces sp. BC1021]|nr:hypothetical protein DFQ29_000558 [Apophysomyces sp. BC1021]
MDDYNDRVKILESRATDGLKTACNKLHEHGLDATPILLKGEAATMLVSFAEERKVDMTIVGSRGLGFLKRKFLGSVSEHLVHHLKSAVMVVKS